MALEKTDDELKRYYSIGEVAERFGIKTSVIRFWEGEFDFLKPHKNAKGDRRFTKANLEQLALIHHLVKERGFTLEGARREISNSKQELKEKVELLDRLRRIRKTLSEL
ncbi:MerR family transcriptional regulator [Lewinellaceae bacterium SD302]|nr:MerR family transcriptional regulator [Lewinellaceae bacterium SD302]